MNVIITTIHLTAFAVILLAAAWLLADRDTSRGLTRFERVYRYIQHTLDNNGAGPKACIYALLISSASFAAAQGEWRWTAVCAVGVVVVFLTLRGMRRAY